MLNQYEGAVVRTFSENLDEYDREQMTLLWKDGSKVICKFDTCFEDENEFDEDDARYEEFTSFLFQKIESTGNPPIPDIEAGELFLINYHNFPDEILAGGVKIN